MDTTMENEKETLADLLSLPPEVFSRYIFPKLEYNDLLRLRRTCHPINLYATDFIRTNLTSQVEREINSTNLTLQHFLQLNLSTTSIFINNSSSSFFTDPLITSFLHLYGSQMTHVKINHFGTFITEHELHFFSSLPNLLHLDITLIDASQRDCLILEDRLPRWSTVPPQMFPFPPNFKNLKSLKLNEIQGSPNNPLGYAWHFIDFCQNLDYLKHPMDHTNAEEWGSFEGNFAYVRDYIQRRHHLTPELPNLQTYDLENLKVVENDDIALKFMRVHDPCWELKVKLLNVDSSLLCARTMINQGSNSPFVSFKNVHFFTFMYELVNLKNLTVESTEKSEFGEAWRTVVNVLTREQVLRMPEWPNLKILDLKIDSTEMLGGGRVEEFLDFLFAPAAEVRGRIRENVRELAIRYDLDKMLFKRSGDDVPIPRVEDVTGICPFVTKLTLQGWMGTEGQVILFWEGLSLLEEVELEECVKLGDGAFVGAEKEKPVFLKLEHLRKLSLKRMDLMEKITDLAFTLIFCNLKLKEFRLTSDEPIKLITVAGIESLLTGDFNKSVERFAFDGWSLDGVSEEKFNELKLKCRASHMI